MSEQKVILELKKLKKHFVMKRGARLKAIEDISFQIYEGEKFGVVGESGCGKSTLGRVILQLYPQTSGACVYYGKTLAEMAPRYALREIDGLLRYQSRAREAYQRSLSIDKKMATLPQGSQEAEALAKKSKECRKEASRQLREGSRTVGSLIVSGKLPEVQALFRKSYQETEKAHRAFAQYSRLEAEWLKAETDGQQDSALSDRLQQLRGEIDQYIQRAEAYREEAFAYRGKDVLPITELCEDAAYRAKLDGNYERGINLGKLTSGEMRHLRRDMQMIFQDPAASLDPRQSIGKAIEEVFVINSDYGPAVRKEMTMRLLEKVGLKREHYNYYPHALSGGQKQRVGIARAIALDPKFVVLDESVSALDVSVQAQILELLNDLSDEKKLTYFFITHDLGVVKYFCDRILVMYLGHVCELADAKTLFKNPLHPYTDSLLASVPRPKVPDGEVEDRILEGEVPSALNPPKGCPFHTRCPHCMDVCRKEKPPLAEVEPGHFTACFLHPASAAEPIEEVI